MRCEIVIVLSAVVSYAAATCTTPLGATSECVSLYDCKDLLSALEQRPLPSYVVSFLRQSQCGFEGYTPRVCCGPLPTQSNTPSSQRPRPVQPTRPSPSPSGGGSAEDSVPAPRGTCGIEADTDRIYGGQFTDLDEFPWMSLMGYRTRAGKLTYQCGGVLINKRYVLTAAHCVVGAIEKDVGKLETVRLGEYDIQTTQDCIDGVCADPLQDIRVSSAFPHPGFNEKNKNRQDDIALVRLADRATYSYYVQPICLVNNNARLEAETGVYVAGWGQTLKGASSPVKQKLSLPIFSKNDCKSKYRTLGAELTDRQICAGGAFAEDACRGDSGGPLMRRSADGVWESVAVVSFGYGCGRDGWPGVYTNVASYLDWIRSTMRANN